MQFGRRIAIHKSVKETNLIKLYFHSYGWFLLLFLNGMLCMIFSYRTLFFSCNLPILRAFAYGFISLFSCFMISFRIHWMPFPSIYFICIVCAVCHSLCCRFSTLRGRYSVVSGLFFTRFNGWWYGKHVLCILSTVIIACVTPNIQSN